MVCFRSVAAVVIVMASASGASACSVCEGVRGQAVRAGLVDEALGRNVSAAVLPFAVLGSVIGVIHFGPPRVFRRREGA